ncbi:thioesterase II family protein [Singulisphaera sp. PoT]|uniref:thioesterase II family protein n=1 Tax=Singulisphaera sp. PoT TaxID=3411797 RepID=UPI003BF51AA9
MSTSDAGALSREVSPTRWWVRWRPNSDARLRLFGFPYAGGGAMIYRSWCAALSPEIDVFSLQLPGRESKSGQPPFQRIGDLIEALAASMSVEIDRPYAFFGQSMGALIAFELLRRLRRDGLPAPEFFVASARVAPQLPLRRQSFHHLPEPEFRDELRRMDGIPAALFDYPELLEVVSPTLRADFALSDHYDYKPEPPLDCPVIAIGGDQDAWVQREDLEGWREQTTGDFRCHVLSGNHFFLKSSEPELLTIVRDAMADAERRR